MHNYFVFLLKVMVRLPSYTQLRVLLIWISAFKDLSKYLGEITVSLSESKGQKTCYPDKLLKLNLNIFCPPTEYACQNK